MLTAFLLVATLTAPTPIRDAAAHLPVEAVAPQSDHRALHVPMAIYLGCAGIDTSTTMYALGRYPERFRESNPLVRGLSNRPALFGLVQYAIPAGIYLLAQHHHGHARGKERSIIKWGLYAGAAMHCHAGYRNTRLLRREGQK